MKFYPCLHITVTCVLMPISVLATDTEAPPTADAKFAIPRAMDLSQLEDSAFSPLVSFGLLGRAVAEGDAAGITDVALQLARAEEILLRNHNSLKSASLLVTAANIAKNSGDKDTLTRIAAAAKALGNHDLVKDVEAAMVLGGASRAIDPPPELSLDMDALVFAEVKGLLNDLEIAENAGDIETLQELLIDLKLIELSDALREWIEKRIELALVASKGADADQARTLSLLADSSRGGLNLGTFRPPSTGIKIRSPFGFRPRESESTNFPMSPGANPRNRMQRNGYRTYNDVRMQSNGQLRIGNRTVQARRGYNPQTGRSAWVYKTRRGGTIIRRDGDNRTWVRPGQRR